MRIFKILATITFVLSLSVPTFAQSSHQQVRVVVQEQLDQQRRFRAQQRCSSSCFNNCSIAAAAVAAVVVALQLVAQLNKKKIVKRGTKTLSPFFSYIILAKNLSIISLFPLRKFRPLSIFISRSFMETFCNRASQMSSLLKTTSEIPNFEISA